MSRQGQSITLSLREPEKEQLKTIATELGITWGDKPNLSKLIEAIARRQLLVLPNHDWSQARITALNQARISLMDAGHPDAALEIAQLLLQRSELSIPLRQELQTYVAAPAPLWRQEIDRYLLQQRSFQLNYCDAAERLWTFTICHGKITPYEKRQYLECWCQETEGNHEIPGLTHNWCFRLDRIAEAAVTPLKRKWRNSLDLVEVELCLLRGLAFGYHRKQADLTDEWVTAPQPALLTESPRYRRIVRQVSNTFWLTREILHYGADCVVISPEIVRDRLRQQVQAIANLYQSQV